MQGAILQHNQNVKTALIDLFPEIGLKRSGFNSTWDSVAKRRNFFADFAKSQNFDPEDPNNWYSQTNAILALKVCTFDLNGNAMRRDAMRRDATRRDAMQ